MTGFMITGKWKQEEKGMQHPQKLVPSQRDPKREMKFPSLKAKTFHMQVKIFHSKLSLIDSSNVQKNKMPWYICYMYKSKLENEKNIFFLLSNLFV